MWYLTLFSKVVAENIFTNIKMIKVSSLHLPNVEHIALFNMLIVKINDDTSKVFCCKSKKLLIGILRACSKNVNGTRVIYTLKASYLLNEIIVHVRSWKACFVCDHYKHFPTF